MNGKVLFNEKPLVFGTVLVIGSDNLSRHSPIAEDGTYSVKDLAPGKAKVAVTSVDPQSIARNIIRREGVDPKLYGGSDNIKGWFPIPSKFGDFATSELNYTINGGENPIDIILK